MQVWEGYLRVTKDIKTKDLTFYNIKTKPFKVYGLNDVSKNFCRMPIDIADKVSGAVSQKNYEPTGGRIRFKTDSDIIAIKIKMKDIPLHPTLSTLYLSGCSLYKFENGEHIYLHSFMQPVDGREYYEGEFDTVSNSLCEYILYMPSSNEIVDIEVGLRNGAVVEETCGYKYEKPIAFYGSSITQGTGASRMGNTYEDFVSRNLDADYINLGFSGNAKGESIMAEYISTLVMSAFVFDYDYNAPDVKHLENTHFAFYNKVRENNPNIPILLVSKPDGGYSEFNLARKDVILKTYLTARENGDKNIYFVDGALFFAGDKRNDCTIDGCHPNDMGYSRMGDIISDVLKYALEKRN